MNPTASNVIGRTEEQNGLITQTLEQNDYKLMLEGRDCVIQYVWRLKGSEHVLFLWENEENRDMMVQELFGERKGESNVLFSMVPRNIPLVENMTYGDFYHTHKDKVLEKIGDKLSSAVAMNHGDKSTRTAFEDDTWLIARGFEDKILGTEEMLGRQVEPMHSLLCMYQRRNVADKTLVKLITTHGYVLLDAPNFRLYKWEGIHPWMAGRGTAK
jgi:hypothetical protein